MRLATITNWAYGATVLLTLVSAGTMIFASMAQEDERAAVAQRYVLDRATSTLSEDVYALTGQARQYVVSGDPTHLIVYRRQAAALGSIEARLRHMRDAGASSDELETLATGMRWADTLHAEQQTAIEARQRGDDTRARQIVFGAEYERDLDQAQGMVERFQYRLDQRTEGEVSAATRAARLWRTTSEIVLFATGGLFLCVLYFILKRRILRPVVKLSDVVTRLAAQDYAVEPPDYGQIDEIGDMAQAIRLFRENGLERQRLEEERGVDHAMRELLSRMTQRMQACDTTRELTDVIARFMPQIAPNLAGRLYLLDPSRNVMSEASAWLSPVHSEAEFSPLTCWALRRGVPHRPAGEAIDIHCGHLNSGDGVPVDSICLPLTAQRETLGLLYLEPRAGAPLHLEEPAGAYLNILAENIGLALANLRLRDTLRKMAMADPLTGLANRRQLETMLDTQLAEAARSGQPISCLLLDVDHFKRFNDTFGHDAGDAVLREVGALLDHVTREGGLACRYGGEEFVVALRGHDLMRASTIAERIRVSIGVTFEAEAELPRVTVSIGVAAGLSDEVETMLADADCALYRAKNEGRNRVMLADGPIVYSAAA